MKVQHSQFKTFSITRVYLRAAPGNGSLLTSFSHLRGLEHGVDDHVDILVLTDLRSQVLGEDDGDVDDVDNDDADCPIHLGVDEEEEVGHAQ